jgi:RIO kinase 1
LESILEDIQIFLRFGIIHSDLSGFNILWWKDQPWIIDLPQAVDIRQNPNSMMLLKRDLENIINFFSKYFEVDREEIFERFNVQFKIHE